MGVIERRFHLLGRNTGVRCQMGVFDCRNEGETLGLTDMTEGGSFHHYRQRRKKKVKVALCKKNQITVAASLIGGKLSLRETGVTSSGLGTGEDRRALS